MQFSPLNLILLRISHMGYLDSSGVSPDILSGTEELSPLYQEIAIIKSVKDHIRSGRISRGLAKLQELHKRPSFQFLPFQDVTKNDVLAFIYYECALFYRIVYDHTAYLSALKIAKLLASSPEINLIIDYQFGTIEAAKNDDPRLLVQFADIFKTEKLPVLETMAYFRMGEIFASKQVFNKAHEQFNHAEEIIRNLPSECLMITAKSNRGYLYYLEKNFQKALEVLTGISDCDDSFQKSLVFENIALVYEALGEYDNALTFWLRSLTLCQDHGVLMNIPEDTLHIGEIYEEHLGSVSQAKFFYKLGYEQSMLIFRDGINISEAMRGVIEKYISYFAEYYVPEGRTKNPPTDRVFSFALGKTWNEIITLFSYNVIVYHKYNSHSVMEMLETLSLKRSNFQAKQQKLSAAGLKIPDFRKNIHQSEDMNTLDALQSYIGYYKNLTWDEILRQFEKEVMKYIVLHYGSKRDDLILRLKISYPNLKKKLDAIEKTR